MNNLQKHDATLGVYEVNFADSTGVRVTPEGVFGVSYKQVGDITSANGSTYPIAPQPISVVASYDSEDGEGIILRAKVRHQTKLIELPRELLGDSRKRQQVIFKEGVKLDLHRKAQEPYWRYVAAAEPAKRVYRYQSTGWHTTEDGDDLFIAGLTKDRAPVIWGIENGEEEDIPPYSFTPAKRDYLPGLACNDDATSWQRFISRAGEYPIAVAAASLAFGAYLARPLKLNCHGGVVFFGDSGVGKTIALRAARAVAGHNEQDGDQVLESFGSSLRYLTKRTEAYRDQIMPIEETQQADPQNFAEFVMAASGLSRGTLNQDSSVRQSYGNPVVWLGCGEADPQTLLDACRTQVGHYHRVLGIDAGHELLYRKQPDHEVKSFERCISQTSGYAGKKFVESCANMDPASIRRFQEKHTDLTRQLLIKSDTPHPNAAQTRAAARLALGLLGGQLAQAQKLIPAKYNLTDLFTRVMRVWLSQDGASKTDAAKLAAQKLLDFVEENTGISFLEGGFDQKARGKLYGWLHAGTLHITRKALQQGLDGYGPKPFCRRLQEHDAIEQNGKVFTFRTPESVTGNHDLTKIRTYRINMEGLRQFVGVKTAEDYTV